MASARDRSRRETSARRGDHSCMKLCNMKQWHARKAVVLT
jgi:hypothetical protein